MSIHRLMALGLAGALALGTAVSASAGPLPIGNSGLKAAVSARHHRDPLARPRLRDRPRHRVRTGQRARWSARRSRRSLMVTMAMEATGPAMSTTRRSMPSLTRMSRSIRRRAITADTGTATAMAAAPPTKATGAAGRAAAIAQNVEIPRAAGRKPAAFFMSRTRSRPASWRRRASSPARGSAPSAAHRRRAGAPGRRNSTRPARRCSRRSPRGSRR